MRRRALAGLLGVALAGVPHGANAVDRAAGRDVPKPSASGAPWTAADRDALRADLDALLREAPALAGAHAGLLAVDARDGGVLYERAAAEAFQPASTLKLVVGSAALERLGPDFRFRTEAFAGGPVAGGRLRGALVVRAGGDPLLGAGDLDALAAAVAVRGVRAIDGGIAFDESRYAAPGYPPGWSIDDLAEAYAPVVGALALEENTVHLTISPGAAAGAAARVSAAPLAPCALDARVVTGPASAEDTVALERDPVAGGCTRVGGTIPLGAPSETLDAAVASPRAYAARVLCAALQRRGVSLAVPCVPGAATPIPAGAAPLWTHDGEPLRDLLADLWIPSDNLIAEMLLLELGVAAAGPPGTREHGAAAELSWLGRLNVPLDAVDLSDGSGLSVYDRMTPRDLVAVLEHDWAGPFRDLILDDLPLAGVRGTLLPYAGTALDRRLFGKTGTLSHVSGLAGYLATARHGAVIFSFPVDDRVGGTAAELRALRVRVLARFADAP